MEGGHMPPPQIFTIGQKSMGKNSDMSGKIFVCVRKLRDIRENFFGMSGKKFL
jgi:hypothetical protein